MDKDNNLTGVIQKLDLGELTSEEQTQIVSQLEQVILEKIISAVAEKLEEKEREDLCLLLDSGANGEALGFLKNKIPNLADLMESSAHLVIEQFKALKGI